MEPLSSQAIVDEDNQDAVVNANVAELESQCDNSETLTATPVRANNDNIPTQPSAPKKLRKTQHRLALVVENSLHHQNESSNLLMMMLKKKMSNLPL